MALVRILEVGALDAERASTFEAEQLQLITVLSTKRLRCSHWTVIIVTSLICCTRKQSRALPRLLSTRSPSKETSCCVTFLSLAS